MMTYAAQVRSFNKSVPSQINSEELYDVKTIRIICKYFVGSLVRVKTEKELIEGILHTLYKNKICLSLVAVLDYENSESVISMSASRIVNLNDIISIIVNNISEQQDVSIPGKYIKLPAQNATTVATAACKQTRTNKQDVNNNNNNNNNNSNNCKTVVNKDRISSDNLKYSNVIKSSGSPQSVLNEKSTVPDNFNEETKKKEVDQELETEITKTTPVTTDSKTTSNGYSSINEVSANEVKKSKSVSLNPNAPVFKPRQSAAFQTNPPALSSQPGSQNNLQYQQDNENVTTECVSNITPIFPPPKVSSPPILSPAAVSSAVFIPNYILVDSLHLTNNLQPQHQQHHQQHHQQQRPITTNTEQDPDYVVPSPVSSISAATQQSCQQQQQQQSTTAAAAAAEFAIPSPFSSPMVPYYSPISFFVPNSSIVKLQERAMSVSESSDEGSIRIAHNVAYNLQSKKKLAGNKNKITNFNNAEIELSNPSNWPPLPEPNNPIGKQQSNDNITAASSSSKA